MCSLGGKDIAEQKIIEKILISLPESFDSIVSAIEESKDLTTLLMQQLISSLEAHEERKLQRNMSNETAFKASSDFKSENFQKRDGNAKSSKQTVGAKSVRRIAMIPNIVGLLKSVTHTKRNVILLETVEQKFFNNQSKPRNKHNH
jgi:serine phosphatase RsbU (regulator of sigma subunit)